MIAYHMLGNILFKLNDVQLDRSGDGFKNYFAVAWQYKYGDGLWFEGMQYPYGDMIAYADGQPALMWLMISLRKIGIDFSGYELLIVQITPIIFLFLAAFILHKIVRSYNIPKWWTVLTVLACISLSPQIYRCNAHYALAYMFCLPSIWWMYILFDRKQLSTLLFIILGTVSLYAYAYLHPYHLLIGSSFLVAIFLVKIFYKKVNWPILIVAILPIILYLITNQVLDPYSDRPKNPWGAWQYKTEIADLFPFYGWYAKLMQPITTIRTSYHEGSSYLGILIFVLPFLFLYNIIKKGEKQTTNHFPIVEMVAALIVLAFSMGLHIMITDHKILDWISTLKQFRALGRFAWPYYYVGFVALSVLLYRSLSTFKSKFLRVLIFSIVVIMWSIDGYFYLRHFNKNMNQYKAPNELYQNTAILNILEEKNIDTKKYQAILPIPVSMEGAEKVTPADQWFVKTQTIPLAFQTGLPLIGAYMSRTSLSRILSQYQLCSSDYVTKSILDDMESDKDLLMVIANEDTLEYNDLITKANYIGKTKETNVYEIGINELQQKTYMMSDSLSKSIDALFYNDYGNNDNNGLLSNGCEYVNGNHQICRITVADTIAKNVTMSLWYRIDEDDSSVPKFSIKLIDKDNQVEKSHAFRDLDMRRMEIIDNWVRILYKTEVSPTTSIIEWEVNAENLYIDHALVTFSDSTYWHKLNDTHVIYNHYIAEIN